MNQAPRAPEIVRVGWNLVEMPGGGTGVWQRRLTGLGVLLSIDEFAEGEEEMVSLGPGSYVHASMSRNDRYPGWDEMREVIRGCGFFDAERDVYMILPAHREYVNIHQNCFHWWQRR